MKKGFTLVELLVVIAIIGLLLAIAIPSGLAISKKIKEKMLDSKIEMIESAAIVYGQNNKKNIPSKELGGCTTEKTLNDNAITQCMSISITDLLNVNALEEDKIEDGNKVLINPITNKPLNECNVEIYIKNKRVYAEYDISGTNCGYEKIKETTKEENNNTTTTKPTNNEKLVTKNLKIKLDYTYFIDPGLQSGYLSSAFLLKTEAITTCNKNKCNCSNDAYIDINCSPIIQNGKVNINGTATGTHFTGINEIEYEENFEMQVNIDYETNNYICVCYEPINEEKYNNFCNYNDCSSYPLGEFFSDSSGYKLLINYWESEADLASNSLNILINETISMRESSSIKQIYISGYNINYDYNNENLTLKEEAKTKCKNEHYSKYGNKYELYCNFGGFSLNIEDTDGNITSYPIDEETITTYPYTLDGIILNKINITLQ